MAHSDLTIKIIHFIVNLYRDSDMLPKAYVDSYSDKMLSASEETIYNLFYRLVDHLKDKEIYPPENFMGKYVGWSDNNNKAYLMYMDLANQLSDQIFEDLILVPR